MPQALNVFASNNICCQYDFPRSKLDPPIMVQSLNTSEKRLRAQQAKEFLISQIVEEARRENVLLSEVERKMLYFTESEETLPDMLDVNDQFERDYDASVYEKKISDLVGSAFKRNWKESSADEQRWKQAIADLRKEDHYLLVMVDRAMRSIRPKDDQLKLLGTALAIVVVLLCGSLFAAKHNVDLSDYFPSRSTIFVVAWGIAACLLIAYVILRLLLGEQRMQSLFVKVLEKIFAPSNRAR